jgi:hypothetical protein
MTRALTMTRAGGPVIRISTGDADSRPEYPQAEHRGGCRRDHHFLQLHV